MGYSHRSSNKCNDCQHGKDKSALSFTLTPPLRDSGTITVSSNLPTEGVREEEPELLYPYTGLWLDDHLYNLLRLAPVNLLLYYLRTVT